MPELPESRPEQYLREIRDLQQANLELQQKNETLLNELVEQKRSQVRWQHFRTAGSIVIMILPYLFSAYLSWLFYVKIQESISSFTNAPKNAIESVTQQTKQLWNDREELLDTTSKKTESMWDSVKSYLSE